MTQPENDRERIDAIRHLVNDLEKDWSLNGARLLLHHDVPWLLDRLAITQPQEQAEIQSLLDGERIDALERKNETLRNAWQTSETDRNALLDRLAAVERERQDLQGRLSEAGAQAQVLLAARQASINRRKHAESALLSLQSAVKDWIPCVQALVEREHERAVGASALFSVEHWKHNAGCDWPELPDDDSYLLLENCVHPACSGLKALAALLPDTAGTTP